MDTTDHKRTIACGMYSLSNPLQQAWSALFQPLDKILGSLGSTEQIRSEVIFSASDQTYDSRQLLLGHTCGYPYMKKWRHSHRLVAVPEFDVEGCDGKRYSSWIVSRKADPRRYLQDFRGCTIAINSSLSNSGMNVFRQALYKYADDGCFAKQVIASGGHLQSMEAVANGSADLAAVDAVTYHHIEIAYPSLVKHINIVNQSEWTTGLPFICHGDEQLSTRMLLDAMNQCIEQLGANHQRTLGLTRFSEVKIQDYEKIILIEREAESAGYPLLN